MVDLDLDLGLTLFSELLLVLDPIINFSLGWVRSWGRLFCSSASEKKISSFYFYILTFCFCLDSIIILEVGGRDINIFRPSPPSSSSSHPPHFMPSKEKKNSSKTQSKFPISLSKMLILFLSFYRPQITKNLFLRNYQKQFRYPKIFFCH